MFRAGWKTQFAGIRVFLLSAVLKISTVSTATDVSPDKRPTLSFLFWRFFAIFETSPLIIAELSSSAPAWSYFLVPVSNQYIFELMISWSITLGACLVAQSFVVLSVEWCPLVNFLMNLPRTTQAFCFVLLKKSCTCARRRSTQGRCGEKDKGSPVFLNNCTTLLANDPRKIRCHVYESRLTLRGASHTSPAGRSSIGPSYRHEGLKEGGSQRLGEH